MHFTKQAHLARSVIKYVGSGWSWWRVLVWLVLVFGAFLMALPFLWLVTSSLKSEIEIFQFPPQWIPNPIHFENYVNAWSARPFPLYVKNTLTIVILNEIAVLLSSSFCAYGFARLKFPGRDFWFSVVLTTMMVPAVVLMVPRFAIFSRINWVDTFLPLTVPQFFGGGAFNIFLLRQFFRTIPEELADAARIDGCSEFGIYWVIMMPLAKPALTTTAIFTFINSWNSFVEPLLYLNSPRKYTVAVALSLFGESMTGRTRWDLIMAASTMMIVPVLLIFFFAQRYFVQGIATSGLKG